MPFSTWFRELGRGLLDVVYPPRCLGCGGRPESVRLPICPRCLKSMERAPTMGVAARLDRLPTGRGLFEDALALWVFDKGGTLQAVQHALKYGDRPRYGVALGRLIGQAYAEAFDEAAAPAGPAAGTRVDGVFTADPEEDDSAEMFSSIHGDEIIRRNLRVMDMTAFTLCQESRMPVIVFNMSEPGNLQRVLCGETVGTHVHWDESRAVAEHAPV